jgi:antitoxin PrlF
MIRSKLTAKAQTTVPRPVREALQLRPGDEIGYRIENGRVILTKLTAELAEDPFATFEEWNSSEDRSGYANL